MIRYLNHSITECEHIDTKEKFYELSHWYYSEEKPNIAGKRQHGFYKNYKEAEDVHNQLLVDGLINRD